MNKAQKQIIKEWRKGHNKYMENKTIEIIDGMIVGYIKEEVKKIDGINCADCGCTPKNDEWYTPQSDIFQKETYCFDCGGEAENEFWVDYAQRKMEL